MISLSTTSPNLGSASLSSLMLLVVTTSLPSLVISMVVIIFSLGSYLIRDSVTTVDYSVFLLVMTFVTTLD